MYTYKIPNQKVKKSNKIKQIVVNEPVTRQQVKFSYI